MNEKTEKGDYVIGNSRDVRRKLMESTGQVLALVKNILKDAMVVTME